MKSLRIHLELLVILFVSVLTGCSSSNGILYSADDLDGSHIAVLDESISDKEFKEVFPESDMVHFKSSSEFLLALAIGKCEAGFAGRKEGEFLLNRNSDYVSLSYAGSDDAPTLLLVHRRLLPGRNQSVYDGDMLQKSFPAFPDRDDISLAAKIVPAKEVGGDLYDFFIENEKLYFIVGDVSGKGIPASLVMAVTCRLFRSIASYLNKPEEIMTSLNDSLSDGNESNMFCTAFLGILDLTTGHLDYCYAGHNAPLVIGTNGNVSAISVEPNLPLGLFSGFPYQGQETKLEKGTMLYLFTDGVNEAEDKEMNQFGDDRLVSLLEKNAGVQPKEIIEKTFAEVQRHADGANQSDDITVMCIKICK